MRQTGDDNRHAAASVSAFANGARLLFLGAIGLLVFAAGLFCARSAFAQILQTVELTKTFVNDPAEPGDTVRLEFTITNQDAAPAGIDTIEFTDDLDAALSGLRATGLPANNVCGAGSQISGTSLLTFSGGVLPLGGSCTFSVTLQVPDSAPAGSFTNTTSAVSARELSDFEPIGGPPASDDLEVDVPDTTTPDVVKNFLSRRARLITIEDPLLTPHLNGSAAQGGNPVNVTAFDRSGRRQVAFSTSLSQLARAGTDDDKTRSNAMALGYAKGLGPPPVQDHPFNIWIRGAFTSFEDEVGNANQDGTFGYLYLGGEYKLRPNLLVGMILQFDWIDGDDNRTNVGAEGDGWMIGPYIVGKFARNIYFQARAAWGQSDNEVTPIGTYTDSFDSDRWLVSGKVEGRFERGPWRVSPIASLIFFEDESERYVDTLGVTVASQTASIGQFEFGPQIAHGRPIGEDLVLEVFGEVTGIWEFDNDNRVINGIAFGVDDARAKLTGGVILKGGNGMKFQASAFADGLGADDYDAYGGTVRVRVPLN